MDHPFTDEEIREQVGEDAMGLLDVYDAETNEIGLTVLIALGEFGRALFDRGLPLDKIAMQFGGLAARAITLLYEENPPG